MLFRSIPLRDQESVFFPVAEHGNRRKHCSHDTECPYAAASVPPVVCPHPADPGYPLRNASSGGFSQRYHFHFVTKRISRLMSRKKQDRRLNPSGCIFVCQKSHYSFRTASRHIRNYKYDLITHAPAPGNSPAFRLPCYCSCRKNLQSACQHRLCTLQ